MGIQNNPDNYNQLSSFFEGLDYYLHVSREAQERLDLQLASRFSVFDYISISENKISEVLADLLNPKGKHGQGRLFLDLFLHQCIRTSPNKNHISSCIQLDFQVFTEYRTINNRPMDIYLKSNDFGIAIENKLWAKEQNEQLSAYMEHLELTFGNHYLFIFLTVESRDPQSIPIQKWKNLLTTGNALHLYYDINIIPWLLSCREKCQADKIRHFLNDFSNYIQQNFKKQNILLGESYEQ